MYTPTKMSVTRALALLKATEAKLGRAVNDLSFSVVTAGTGDHVTVPGTALSVSEVANQIVNRYNSVTDLLSLRERVKSAIVLSNAVTDVEVGARTLKVAEAIELKRSIAFEEKLLVAMRKDFVRVQAGHTVALGQFNLKVEQATAASFGKDKKVTAEDIALVTGPLSIKGQVGLLDPLNHAKLIEELEAKIEDFNVNVDFALSESNAVTQIEV
jgi:hypothetical protein